VVLALVGDLPGRRWRRVLDPLAPLVQWLGFEQRWAMFAPDPATSDRDLQVILELPSGAGLVWEPPRLHERSRWRAFREFRYRSYEHALLYEEHEEPSPACAGLAEYLLRKYASRRPMAVVFAYVDRPIPPPGGDDVRPLPARGVFYRYHPPEKVP
jgi:hypothetical protein